MVKVLLLALGTDRGTELIFDSTKKHIIDRYNADVMVVTDSPENKFLDIAKYVHMYSKDIESEYDKRSSDWRRIFDRWSFLKEKQGETHVLFINWLAYKNLPDGYDWYIAIRDSMFFVRFPNLEKMDKRYVWTADGVRCHGMCNKTIIGTKENISKYLNTLDGLFESTDRFLHMMPRHIKSIEYWQKHNVVRQGGIVKIFPTCGYIKVRSREYVKQSRTSTFGFKVNEDGTVIKYLNEYRMANENTLSCIYV
jgi:hypothetical protein